MTKKKSKEMSNELVLVETSKEEMIAMYESGGVEKLVEDITSKVLSIVPDTSTGVGRKMIAKNARMVASSKVFIDSVGKELNSEIKNKAKLIDAVRKFARDTLDEARDKARQPLTDYEDAEQKRIQDEKRKADYLTDHSEAVELDILFDRERDIQRREDEANEKAKAQQEQEEKRQKEIDKAKREKEFEAQAKADAEREAQEKIKLANDEAKRAKELIVEQEKKAAAAAIQAESDRLNSINRAKIQEQQRLEKIESDKQAANLKRERDNEHTRKVRSVALQSLIYHAGVDEDTGKRIIVAIHKGLVTKVSINY